MAEQAKPAADTNAEPPLPRDEGKVPFAEVFASELVAINVRQQVLTKTYPNLAPSISGSEPTTVEKARVIDAIGLALSGGGIRSAAFCLGVLQALDAVLCEASTKTESTKTKEKTDAQPSLLERVDYLSTVSGGGYVGCSLTANLSKTGGRFPFQSRLDETEGDAIKHIRDYSNYLFPHGFFDLLDSIAIYLRGLLANIVIVLPLILLFVILTILANPTDGDLLRPNFYHYVIGRLPVERLRTVLACDSFGFTYAVFVLSLFVFFLWGLKSVIDRVADFAIWKFVAIRLRKWRSRWKELRYWWTVFAFAQIPWLEKKSRLAGVARFLLRLTPVRSDDETQSYSETRSRWARVGGLLLFLLLLCAFCESQPLVLDWLFSQAWAFEQKTQSAGNGNLYFWIQAATVVLTAFGAIVSFFSDKLDKLAKNFAPAAGWLPWLARYSSKALILAASVAVPLVVWWIYLMASFWGIKSGIFALKGGVAAPDWLCAVANKYFLSAPADVERGFVAAALYSVAGLPVVSHVSAFVLRVASAVKDNSSAIAGLYAVIAMVLGALSLIPTLNANSLHRLYRDRLSAAFVFYFEAPARDLLTQVVDTLMNVVGWFFPKAQKTEAASPEEAGKPAEIRLLDRFKLTELSVRHAPYHIINAALNIQGSSFANQRARNADFFMFSRNFVGSEATGYATTLQMESVTRDLNLATAMAVSGAAASANMGSGTIRSLTPSLALLNVRLGYWLRNPGSAAGYANRILASIAETGNWYFLRELAGWLTETAHNVYLTDGGHIENLGVYELLKRRCRLIIAVDAEADPQMTFPSLVKLERHARIDLGIRIDLPWQAIRNASLAVNKKIEDRDPAIPNAAEAGPHCALGIIKYPNRDTGYLLYIKSSLSGDENDYVLDYKRRNQTFPHETTSDQLFTEEQFEVYRALGFHAAHHAFLGKDRISTIAAAGQPSRLLKWRGRVRKDHPLHQVRELLLV